MKQLRWSGRVRESPYYIEDFGRSRMDRSKCERQWQLKTGVEMSESPDGSSENETLL